MQTAPKKARLNAVLAFLVSTFVAAIFLALIWGLRTSKPEIFYILAAIAGLVCYSNFRSLTAKFRKRDEILKQPFPAAWRIILGQKVDFYHSLSEENKERFEQKVQIFLAEKRITGIQTDIDDTVRLLVAASAIIPIFGFPEWEYDNLGEVLIYPGSFDENYEQEGEGRFITGMVGSGPMNNIMILSKPALIGGFANPRDGRNVGIHEFVHLMDSGDGTFDGIPALLEKPYIIPWLRLIHLEMLKIEVGTSGINPYGATSEVEFFAVASEYFFENPKHMQTNHKELYDMLTHIFHQHPAEQLKYAVHSMMGYTGKKIGRNAPCPCKSGKKYKKCCLGAVK